MVQYLPERTNCAPRVVHGLPACGSWIFQKDQVVSLVKTPVEANVSACTRLWWSAVCVRPDPVPYQCLYSCGSSICLQTWRDGSCVCFFFLPSRVVCSLSGFWTPPSARLFCITTVMPSHNAVSSNNWGAYSDLLKLDYKTLEKKFPQPFKLIVLAFFAPNQLGFNLEMLINFVRLVKSLFTPRNQEFCKGCIRSCSPRSAFPRRLRAWNFWGDCIFIPSVHFNGCPWRGRISTSRLCL